MLKKIYFSGGIDPQTHFEVKMMGTEVVDDFYDGTKAAIAGGTTTISKYSKQYSNESLQHYEDIG